MTETTKTIQTANFVQYIYELEDAINEGFTVVREPNKAPKSTPHYEVTLVQKVKQLVAATEVLEAIVEKLAAPTVETKVETPLVAPPQKPMGRPKK